MINYFRLLCATNIRFHLLFREIIKTKKHEQTVIFKSDILTGKIKRGPEHLISDKCPSP
jgi:hypothetical protein